MNNYEDIINLPHHVSKNHPQMSIQNRAAQFSPFSALTGYEEAINETKRITFKKKILEEDKKEEINAILQIIEKNISATPLCTITFFEKDKRKEGGIYITITQKIKRIDPIYSYLVTLNNKKILINDIINIIYEESN